MINECLFLPENSEHCSTSQNKHKPKMKLNSIPHSSDRAAIIALFSLRRGNTKLSGKSKRQPWLMTLKVLAFGEKTLAFFTWPSHFIVPCPCHQRKQNQGQPSLSPKLCNPNHRADLTLESESLLPS